MLQNNKMYIEPKFCQPLPEVISSIKVNVLPKLTSPTISEMDTSPMSPTTISIPNSPGPLSLPPKPHAQERLLSSVNKCQVCGETATKHIHYGAVSCFSCRAFFRRSIQNNTAMTYVCRRKKDCQINLKTRRNCQYCRYEKCLSMGMQPSWVLSKEERNQRFKKNRDKTFKCKNQVINDGTCSVMSPTVIHTACSEGSVMPGKQIQNINYNLITQTSPINIQLKREVVINPSTSPATESQWQAPHVSILPLDQNSLKKEKEPYPSVMKTYGSSSPVHLVPFTSSQGSSSTHSVISFSNGKGGVIVRTSPVSLVPEQIQSNLTFKSSPMSASYKSQHIQISPAPLQQTVSPTTLSTVIKHQSVTMPLASVSQAPSVNSFNGSNSLSPTKDLGLTPSSQENMSISPVSKTHLVHPVNFSSSQQNNYVSFHSQSIPFCYRRDDTQFDYCEEMYTKTEPAYEESIYSTSSDEEGREFCRPVIEPEIKFSDEEHTQLKMLVQEHDERYGSVNFGESLIKEMIMCSMFGIPVSTSAAISGYRLTVERMTRIANNLNYFTDLPKMDQELLMKENADLLVSLRGAIFFDSRKKGLNQLLISLGVGDMATIKSTIFTPLMKESSLNHIDYKTFNSIQQVKNNEVETRYNDLQSKVAKGICDEICTILLTYIILFSADFCTLTNRLRVEKIQEQFIRILQRYIYSQWDRQEACGKFAAALDSVICIREMADIKKQRAMNQAVKLPA